jgi:hypothetical protein
MSTPTPTPVDPAIAEQHRIEHLVAGLRFGESTVVNGTPVTAINVEVADLLARHRWASARCSRLSIAGDYDGWWRVQDELSLCRCQLAAAGMLHLVEVVS